MFAKHSHHARQLGAPATPIMAARQGMKFVLNAQSIQKRGKLAIGRQQPFLLTAAEIKVRKFGRVRSSRFQKRIISAPTFTPVGPEELPVSPGLTKPLQ